MLLPVIRYLKSFLNYRERLATTMPSANQMQIEFVESSHVRFLRPNPILLFPNLPLHLVWSVTLSQAECASEIASEEWLLLDGC